MKRTGSLDIAIVGMACRFPGASDLFAFWANILAGVDARTANFPEPTTSGSQSGTLDEDDPEQLLFLQVARIALTDAGLDPDSLDGQRVEQIVERSHSSHRSSLTRRQHGRVVAQMLSLLESLHPEWLEDDREAIRLELQASLALTEAATIPGPMTQILGSQFDRVDAPGASGLLALELGTRRLVEARADLVIVGGVSLMADGESPGPSGGVGVVILKRRVDAERDGHRIYAIIRGIGVAVDERAPGQATSMARAIRRAYRSSGIDPGTVGLIEAHGLSIPSADRAEIRALKAVFPGDKAGRRSLGAVSSMIGQTMAASGMAGLIKVALALHHQVLPPTGEAGSLLPSLEQADPPFTLNRVTRPWVHGDPSTPRRAGLNAFGDGSEGSHAHAILEEHPGSSGLETSGALLNWETEAILLDAPDRPAMVDRIQRLIGWLQARPTGCLKDLAYTLNTGGLKQAVRLGLVVKSLDDLASRLETCLNKLGDPATRSIRDARGAYYWERDASVLGSTRVAFLFPGEGSQYPGMLGDLCPHFPEVRALFDTSDRIAREAGASTWPSESLFGDGPGRDQGLWSAEVAVNVVLSSQWALYQLLTRLGIKPDAVLGHSSGELLALAASGVVAVDRDFEEQLGELGAIFGRLEASGTLPSARLVAVASRREVVELAIGDDSLVDVAMDNCPHQVVIAGTPGSVEMVVARLKGQGVSCEDLPFTRAYHTPGFALAVEPIARFFSTLAMKSPRIPIYSCASQARMPDDPGLIRQLGVDQWSRAVEFRRTVEAMHLDGFETFVDVGARGNLAGFVEDTLRGRPSFAVAANLPRRSGLTQLNHLVASLFARGVDLKPDHLYQRRRPIKIDLESATRNHASTPETVERVPTIRLSEGLIERLKARTAATYAAKKHVGIKGFHHEANGRNGQSTPAFPEESWTRFAMRGDGTRLAEAMPLSFQKTMDAFLDTQSQVLDAIFGVKSTNSPNDTPRPWQGELLSMVPGREAVSILTLEVEGDPVAENHTLGGRRISAIHPDWRGLAVLPFSVMAEILAEGASRLASTLSLVGLRDVRAHKWIRYEDEPVALEVRSEVNPANPTEVRVSIHNRGLKRAIRPLEPAVFEGVVLFEGEPLSPPMASPFALENPVACRFTPDSIYAEQWLFHGPALQAVVGIGPISMGGIEGTLRVLPQAPLLREGQDARGLMTDPIILDNFTHLLGGWGLDRLADDGDVIFPLRMDQLSVYGHAPAEGSDVSCRITIQEFERHRVRVDAEVVRGDGRTWMAIRGWEDWRFHWPARYRDGFRQPDRTLLGESLDLPIPGQVAAAVWLEPPLDMGRPVWRDVLEHVQLGPDERASYLAMPGPDFRRTHRLWGRIAAKEAARRIWLALGHPPVYPADLIIERDPLGRPRLRSRLEPTRDDLPAITIAHVDGVALAMATLDPSSRIGIDVEPIVERSSTFEASAFSLGEIAMLGDLAEVGRAEWVARLWCVKEATAKATGLGFVDGPSGVEVVAMGEDGAMLAQLRGGLADRCPDLASRPIRVASSVRGGHVWAWTRGEQVES